MTRMAGMSIGSLMGRGGSGAGGGSGTSSSGSNPIMGRFSMDHEDSVFRDDGSGGFIGTVRQAMKKEQEGNQNQDITPTQPTQEQGNNSEVGPAGGTNSDGQTGIAANFTGLADKRKPWAGLSHFQGINF